jgi:hypothetical protein
MLELKRLIKVERKMYLDLFKMAKLSLEGPVSDREKEIVIAALQGNINVLEDDLKGFEG